MSGPAVVIRLPLEGTPQVLLDCLDESEEKRLLDWLDSHPDYGELVAFARRLGEGAS